MKLGEIRVFYAISHKRLGKYSYTLLKDARIFPVAEFTREEFN